MPGGRSVWIVTMKLMPVKIELKPRMNTPDDGQDDRPWRSACCRACRTSSRCRAARATSASTKKQCPDQVQVKTARDSAAERPRPWPRASSGSTKLPSAAECRDEEQEDHDRPVQREQAVVASLWCDRVSEMLADAILAVVSYVMIG